ncbi:MAG: glyoxylate/hydroxypyruvate reductase A [Cyclobacteriaceae bacterium]
MSIIIDSMTKDLSPWIQAFKHAIPEEKIVQWDDQPDLKQVQTAIVWNHRSELFDCLPNLKMVCSLGAGVDHIFRDESLPDEVLVTRIISEELSAPMSNFCIGAILYYQRQFDKYLVDKEGKIWDQQFNPEREKHVGIMGMGQLGSDLATKLVGLGFTVSGLSRSRKVIKGVQSFIEEEMANFLADIDYLVVLLPATSENKGILNNQLFDMIKPGAYLINVARGHHQVNQDIVQALDSGKLGGAFLDVFPKEPLPVDDPLWVHPKVFITPHIAVVTKLEAAVPQIVENHRRMLKGEDLCGVANKLRGY